MKKIICVFCALYLVCDLRCYPQRNADNSELEDTVRSQGGKIEELEQEIKELKQEVKKLKEKDEKKAKEEEEKKLQKILDTKTPDEIIKNAEEMMRNNDTKGALDMLELFMKKHSNAGDKKSIYCGMVLFCMGNCYMKDENYEEAALKYVESYRRNPKSKKSAEVLYNLSKCFRKLNRKSEQKSTLEKLINNYPASDKIVKNAQKDLADLR